MAAKNPAYQPRVGSTGSLSDCTVMVDAAAPSNGCSSDAASDTPPKPRVYYIDWLRVFLTVIVVVHHCVTTYLTSVPWKARKGDTAHWLLVQLFVNGNQAYFMTLFFFISGIYVPPSYKRKGAVQFLVDRTLRLVVPCLVFSLVLAPLQIWFKGAVTNPAKHASLVDAFRGWLKPRWPSTYILPTGPPWFIWMLWCFNVAYVILAVLADSPPGKAVGRLIAKCSRRCRQQKLKRLDIEEAARRASGEYTTQQCIVGGFSLIMVLFVLQYGVRMLNTFMFDVQPAQFVQRGPFVAFMPDFFVVYVVAFGLGIFSGPSRWNVCAQLPTGWACWLLSCGGIWWALAGWVPNVALFGLSARQKGVVPFVLIWLLRTFVEQSFCVVWSAGLLVLFRQAFNVQPNWLGRQLVNGAYGAYIVHPVLICVWAWLFMTASSTFPSAAVSAAVISAPTVLTSWLVAVAVRALPFADRVL